MAHSQVDRGTALAKSVREGAMTIAAAVRLAHVADPVEGVTFFAAALAMTDAGAWDLVEAAEAEMLTEVV